MKTNYLLNTIIHLNLRVMKKVILMLAVAAMASCAKSELTERPEVVGDVAIVAGSSVVSVDTRTPFEGTLDDTANKTLTAYVYATKLDNTGAYVSYAAENLAAQGYMTFAAAAVADASSKYPVAAVGFQKEGTTPGTYVNDPQYYPSNDNPLYMVALVPASTTDWTLDADAKNAEYMIDGKTDIMAAAVTKMNNGTSDIKKTEAKIDATTPANSVYPAFDFKHKLTLVNVKAYTPTQKEQAAWGKITKIELIAVYDATATALSTNGVNQKCTVKLEDASATFSGATVATDVTPFYAYNDTDKYTDLLISTQDDLDADTATPKTHFGPVEIATAATAEGTATVADAKYVAYSMIAPFTVRSTGTKIENMKLKIYTEENEDGIEAIVAGLYDTNVTDPDTGTIYMGSTEGKKFDVTLKFSGKQIVASATVTDWDEKHVGEVEVI